MLTTEQKRYFDTFGFVLLRQHFSKDEVRAISQAFDGAIEEARAGAPFTAEKRQMVIGFVEHTPGLTELIEDDRIYNAFGDLLGPELTWITSDGNLYVGDTEWHHDANIRGYNPIKAAFYLDPVGRDSGALRVIPGSHKESLHSSVAPVRGAHMSGMGLVPAPDADGESFGVSGADVPYFALESEPGDVVLFSGGLYHASYGGGNHRRMFTLNFAARAKGEPEVKLHRELYAMHLGQVQADPYRPRDYVYGKDFLGGGGPRRQEVVEQLVQWGFE